MVTNNVTVYQFEVGLDEVFADDNNNNNDNNDYDDITANNNNNNINICV